MSRDQRVSDNHALLAAQAYAIECESPLMVLFCARTVTGRSYEQYDFMYKGLVEVALELRRHHVLFVVRKGSTNKVVDEVIRELSPAALFFDFSPLKGAKRTYDAVATTHATVPCFLVDTHNCIPAWVVSEGREFAAHTMRRKVVKQLAGWFQPPPKLSAHPHIMETEPYTEDLNEYSSWIAHLSRSGISFTIQSGESEALKMLEQFISQKLARYATQKNDPNKDALSGLSPYLHFGMISSLRVALEVQKTMERTPLLLREARLPDITKDSTQDIFLEELIVRKELADNFCYYSDDYTSMSAAWPWAQETLSVHASDVREYVYTFEQFRDAATHDPLWNAAQSELRKTGKVHGYMRMYWAKKILEWSESPDEAIRIAIMLNDFYSLDGGDPNGYAGILWSIAGVHDRPWFNRPVYGMIRYMAASGASKKFDVATYCQEYL